MGQKFKTINAGEASAEVLEQVRLDVEKDLNISVSYSDAIQIACSAYIELKKLKISNKKVVSQ